MQSAATLPLVLALLAFAAARTDLSGCTSSTAGPSLVWYVPGTGELCDFLDCGGGRAPPKTTVPGCAGYVGTATYSPSFLPGFGAATSTSAALSAPTTSAEGAGLSTTATATATASSRSETGETLLQSVTSRPSSAVGSATTTAAASAPESWVTRTGSVVAASSLASNYSLSAALSPSASSPSVTLSATADAAPSPSGPERSTITSTAVATATAAATASPSRSSTPLGASPTTTGAGSVVAVPALVGVVAAGLALVLGEMTAWEHGTWTALVQDRGMDSVLVCRGLALALRRSTGIISRPACHVRAPDAGPPDTA
ncbi:hypothetical protein JHW43_008597 [Diplocarpon mali]|nr:hypothetical protein JHW43_008597 [Diplocarpon mali]